MYLHVYILRGIKMTSRQCFAGLKSVILLYGLLNLSVTKTLPAGHFNAH